MTSKDGTAIAFDRSGDGPPVVLVGGALSTRGAAETLAGLLAPSFTVYAYDRRGRGDSGHTPPYAVEREVEDIQALLEDAGGSAFAFGHSSGGVLALEAGRTPTASPSSRCTSRRSSLTPRARRCPTTTSTISPS